MARKNILDITAQKFAAQKLALRRMILRKLATRRLAARKTAALGMAYAAARRLPRCAADDALH